MDVSTSLYVTQASAYRIRKALAGRGQLEAITVTLEENEPGFALDCRHVSAHSGCGDTQLGARCRQVSMPRGNLEHHECV